MTGTPGKKTAKSWFEVLVSFSGLEKGDVFSQEADDLGWALQHVQSGYLREISEEQAGARYGRQAG